MNILKVVLVFFLLAGIHHLACFAVAIKYCSYDLYWGLDGDVIVITGDRDKAIDFIVTVNGAYQGKDLITIATHDGKRMYRDRLLSCFCVGHNNVMSHFLYSPQQKTVSIADSAHAYFLHLSDEGLLEVTEDHGDGRIFWEFVNLQREGA